MPKKNRMIRVKLRGKWRNIKPTSSNMMMIDSLVASGKLKLKDVEV